MVLRRTPRREDNRDGAAPKALPKLQGTELYVVPDGKYVVEQIVRRAFHR
jgi:hypothetical protein